jgi:hypothetical protein
MRRVLSSLGLLLAAMLFAVLPGILPALSHTAACSQSQSGDTTVWTGHEHRDECFTGGGKDSLFLLGGDDYSVSGGGRDKHRGATGMDYLDDTGLNQSDNDSFCDGDGLDTISTRDGDGQDDVHLVSGDGAGDNVSKDPADPPVSMYAANNCPIPAP